MLVKCPKCRYSFEVTTAPGITAVQCNCPRCGTPFTYTGPASADAKPSAEDMSADIPPVAPVTPVDEALPVPPPTPAVGVYESQPIPPPIPEVTRIPRRPQPAAPSGAVPPRKRRKSGCCLRPILLTIAVIAAIVFFSIHRCGSSTEPYTGSDGIPTEIRDDVSVPAAVATDGVTAAAAYDSSATHGVDHEHAPEWIQGNWHVDTDYGGITLKIEGHQVAETTGGQTSYGTFRYHNHRLVCEFGDGSTFEYRLDPDRQMIDAGDGLLMQKIDQ